MQGTEIFRQLTPELGAVSLPVIHILMALSGCFQTPQLGLHGSLAARWNPLGNVQHPQAY